MYTFLKNIIKPLVFIASDFFMIADIFCLFTIAKIADIFHF